MSSDLLTKKKKSHSQVHFFETHACPEHDAVSLIFLASKQIRPRPQFHRQMFWVAGLRVLEDLRLKKMRHANIFMALSLGYNHQQMSEGQRQKSSEFCNRTASESNVYLNSFHYPDHSYKDQAFDTLSLDSSDSMETSISACSPDNISR